jgi:mRNA interferase YafQ
MVREASGLYGKKLKAMIAAFLSYIEKCDPLPPKYNDHALAGKFKDFRDCHLKPDLVLIYRVNEEEVELARLGSHSELGL